ncbi:MAG: class I SAM-dependent methyltransferase, partial [Betaproteobacteria bacterium]
MDAALARAPDTFAAWRAWLDSPPGRYLLAWEQAVLDDAVVDVFGYHALQCGPPGQDFLRSNRMPHRIVAHAGSDPALGAGTNHSLLSIDQFEELPFASQSLDLVVLPHVLEMTSDPHQVLREVDRVLRPEGRLIVTGFNPV